jgi:phosphopantothenoylcysteine decarboxylase/phosphopantothenate--cysteine ligase
MSGNRPLIGRTALVTAGPTEEPIDPMRYITNRATGKGAYHIAEALAAAGASTTLVTGPSPLTPPMGVTVERVVTAQEMYDACMGLLPVDIAVCGAAVADWRVDKPAAQKIKKRDDSPALTLHLVENPDILRSISGAGADRPRVVVGFAGETEHVVEHAVVKRRNKGCDWILANDLSPDGQVPGVFGGDHNQVTLVGPEGAEPWPVMTKKAIAERLVFLIVERLSHAD